MHSQLKLISMNVNGLNKKEKIDVIMVQETHLTDSEHEKLKKFGYRNTYFSSFKQGRGGVAILISNSVNFEYISESRDKEGRYVLIKGKIDNNKVTFCNVYAPPDERWALFGRLFNLIATETSGILVCGGDFNFILNPKLDSTNKQGKKT